MRTRRRSSWSRAVAWQLLRTTLVVVVVAVVAFWLAEAAPGTASERAARAAGVMPADHSLVAPELRAQLLAEVARTRDIEGGAASRFARFAKDLSRFRLGHSWRDGSAVSAKLRERTWDTLLLVGLALCLAVFFGLGLALFAAKRPGGALDVALSAMAAVAVAVPPVWLALLLTAVFALGSPWHWLPAEGATSSASMVLPVISLMVVPVFVIARHTRAALVAGAIEPWAVAARARGASKWRVLARHVLAVEAPMLLPLLVALVTYLLGAAVVIERVFGLGGLGGLLLDAAGQGDQPVVIGVCVVFAAIIAVVSSAVELGRHGLDPRASRGSRGA